MGKSNKKIKEKMIELYGPECFIEKLHLRKDSTPRKYTGKNQMKKMKQLTYHHIQERSKGGKATLENGALLSAENHIWFNKQSPEKQRAMNEAFQTYKKTMNVAIMQGPSITDAKKLEFDMTDCIEIPLIDDTIEDRKKYNRAKAKREWQKEIDDELEI